MLFVYSNKFLYQFKNILILINWIGQVYVTLKIIF